MRCRPGIVTSSESATIPDQRCTADALRRVRETQWRAKLEKGRGEHLQKQAEAQRAVPEAQLVEAVRAVLKRHGLVSG